ncbi:MAG: hypothetical protein WC796_01830 [Candidatus Pacearchaeota archaeon]|jgi:hypothetical protein
MAQEGLISRIPITPEQVFSYITKDNCGRVFFDDLKYLGHKEFHFGSGAGWIHTVAKSVLNYEQMWHDLHVQDSFDSQFNSGLGVRPLYVDGEHKQINPNLTPKDVLVVFKEFMRVWAAREHTGYPERDWDKMQEEIASRGSTNFSRTFWFNYEEPTYRG